MHTWHSQPNVGLEVVGLLISHFVHFLGLFLINFLKMDRTSFNWTDVQIFLSFSRDELPPEVASVVSSFTELALVLSLSSFSIPASSKFLAQATSPSARSSSASTYLST
jgi:hypothetical protein